MGAGKSTVGPLLAEQLGLPFVDSDAAIEARQGRTIAEIFAAEGEAAFREIEREAIEGLAASPRVVALGGGAITYPGTAERLAATGTVVYLEASPEVLADRVGEGDARPLLAGLDAPGRAERLRALWIARRSHYEAASLRVATDGREPEAIACEIATGLEGAGRR
jgi:shikimate kinase